MPGSIKGRLDGKMPGRIKTLALVEIGGTKRVAVLQVLGPGGPSKLSQFQTSGKTSSSNLTTYPRLVPLSLILGYHWVFYDGRHIAECYPGFGPGVFNRRKRNADYETVTDIQQTLPFRSTQGLNWNVLAQGSFARLNMTNVIWVRLFVAGKKYP